MGKKGGGAIISGKDPSMRLTAKVRLLLSCLAYVMLENIVGAERGLATFQCQNSRLVMPIRSGPEPINITCRTLHYESGTGVIGCLDS